MNVKLTFFLCHQTIPAGIFKLRQLRLLDLSNNLLTELTNSIGDLVGLKVLRLANNSVEVIPATLGNLSLLEELNLAKNRIKILPREIKGNPQIHKTKYTTYFFF